MGRRLAPRASNNDRLSPISGVELIVWYGFKLIGVVLLGSVALNIRRLATNRAQAIVRAREAGLGGAYALRALLSSRWFRGTRRERCRP